MNLLFSRFIPLLVGLLICASVSAQEPNTRPTADPMFSTDRIVYGGSMGLRFGSFSLFEVSPLVGYKLTDRLVPGVGFRYLYFRENYAGNIFKYNIVGGCVFARFYFIDALFAHAEYEVLNAEWDPFAYPNQRFNVSSVLVGGGYRQLFNDKFSSYIMILYDTTQDRYSPYVDHLVFRAGIGIGL
jgi:hypothetical protein